MFMSSSRSVIQKVIFAGSMLLAILLFFGFFIVYTKKVSMTDGYIAPIIAQVLPSRAPLIEKKIPEEIQTVTLLFGGDMMFDRSIRTAMRKRGNDFPLVPLKDLFTQSDIVVANLEGPITDNFSRSEGSVIGSRENYFFTFDPSVAKSLKDAGVGMVNLGNNHILNFNEEGVVQTKKYLEAAEVGYFGAPTDTEHRYWVRDVKGL